MNDYPFNNVIKSRIEFYFECMRYRVIRSQYDIYCMEKDEFVGYITGLRDAGVISTDLRCRLFDIANVMYSTYLKKGVC